MIGHLSSFPNISVVGSELQFPFQSLLKIKKFNEIILKAQISKLVIINLYDDWLKTISSYSAFSRLIIILKAIHINYKKVTQNLNVICDSDNDTRYFWNKFDTEDWISFENIMIKMITKDYFTRNNIKNTELTKSELNDVLFGIDISLKHKQIKKENQNNIENKITPENTTKITLTKDKHSQSIVSYTKSPYENVKFISEYNWKKLFYEYHEIELNKIKILMSYKNNSEGYKLNYIISLNLVKKILELTDLNIGLFGLLYGVNSKLKQNVYIKFK